MRSAGAIVLALLLTLSASASSRLNGFLQEELRAGVSADDGRSGELLMLESWVELRSLARSRNRVGRMVVRLDAECDAVGYCDLVLDRMLHEAYVELSFPHLIFSFGRQVFNWGMADEFNPSDLLNPEDLTQFMTRMKAERKLGVEAARAEVYFGNFRWEMVWLPIFRPPILPGDGAVWAPAELAEMDRMADEYPALLEIEDERLPEIDMENSSVASRIRATLGPVDLGAFGFYGWDYIPIYDFRYDFSGEGPMVVVVPEYQRLWAAGAEFAAVAGSFTVRAEGAYYGDRDYNIDTGFGSLDMSNPFKAYADLIGISRREQRVESPSYAVALGADRTFGENFYINVQYYRQQILDYDRDIVFPEIVDGLLVRIHDMFLSQTLLVGVNATVGFFEGDGMVEPFVEYDITDDLEASAGGFILYGGDDTTFGEFDGNDLVYVRFRYSF